ncbi:MAG TPA: hypothetical protein VHG09_14350 [Longimicrobiales bacterium]|nr:hypothetical protein [Longimicrobiales bacterium]
MVIDSMSGFELALAPTFRADVRESLYRLMGALTGAGNLIVHLHAVHLHAVARRLCFGNGGAGDEQRNGEESSAQHLMPPAIVSA